MASGKKKVPKQQQSSSSGERTRNEDAAKVSKHWIAIILIGRFEEIG